MPIVPESDILTYQNKQAPWHLLEDGSLQGPEWRFNLDYNDLSSSGISSGILKAFKHPRQVTTVFDMSAGLGRDSLSLALMGFEVHSVEPHPVLMTLMHSAYKRMSQRHQLNWHFHYCDLKHAIDHMQTPPDIIYFDPMFEGRKAAKPQKYTQVLQEFASIDSDNYQTGYLLLLDYCQKHRVKLVVKQPQNRKARYIRAGFQEIRPNKSTAFLIYAF